MNGPLDSLLARLQGTLEELIGLHERFLPVLEEKRDALQRMDRVRLADILVHEENLVGQIAMVEAVRTDTVAALAGPLGLAGPFQLGDLIARLPETYEGTYTRTLAALRQTLRDLLQKVRRVTEVVKALTEQSLGHVRYFLRVLTGAEENRPTYDRFAKERQATGYAVLDRKA